MHPLPRFATLAAALAALALSAAALPAAEAPSACTLLTRPDVERVTRRPVGSEAQEEAIGMGTACHYGEAQLIVISGAGAVERWGLMMKRFGYDAVAHTPVSGLGADAYSFTPAKKHAKEDANAFVVDRVGEHLVVMSVSAPAGKSADTVLIEAVTLAKQVRAKLK